MSSFHNLVEQLLNGSVDTSTDPPLGGQPLSPFAQETLDGVTELLALTGELNDQRAKEVGRRATALDQGDPHLYWAWRYLEAVHREELVDAFGNFTQIVSHAVAVESPTPGCCPPLTTSSNDEVQPQAGASGWYDDTPPRPGLHRPVIENWTPDDDIHFLGPTVSDDLHLRDNDVERLQEQGLPLLATPKQLADALGISVKHLRWLAFHNRRAACVHYVSFQAPKRNGGVRTLQAPLHMIGRAQRWILENILNRLPVEEPCHGFRAGRGVVTNARAHVGQAFVVNLDLEAFFPSIGWRRVKRVFHRLGYSPCISTILALLCTECPRTQVVKNGLREFIATGPRGLPQGACTSPALSNQVARRLDRRLAALANRLRMTYTRYADDLTFSGPWEATSSIAYLLSRVRLVVREEGFRVNELKTRVQRRKGRQLVTGLVVNDRPGVCRREVKRLRALLHRARFTGLEAQNLLGVPDMLAWLRGKIAYVGMARPEVAKKLSRQLDAVLAVNIADQLPA